MILTEKPRVKNNKMEKFSRLAENKKPFFFVILWISAFFLFGVLSLKGFPPVNYNLGDEIWSVGKGMEHVQGRWSKEILEPRIYFVAQGVFVSALGGGVFSARLFSLICASFALYLVYLLGREMHSPGAGLAASLVAGSSYAFLWQSKVARPEMLGIVFVLSAFLFLIKASKDAPGKKEAMFLFLSGFIAAISVQVHPSNLQYALSMSVIYLFLFRKRLWSPASAFFLSGLLFAFAIWFFGSWQPALAAKEGTLGDALEGVRYVYPFPILKGNVLALLRDTLQAVPRDIREYLGLFNSFFSSRVDIRIVAACAAALWAGGMLTGQRRDVLILLGFVFVSMFVNRLITDKFNYWHMVEFYPFFALAAVFGALGISEGLFRGAKGRRIATSVLVGFFILTGMASTVAAYRKLAGYDYEGLIEKLSPYVSGSRVLAADIYAPAVGPDGFVGLWFDVERIKRRCPPFEEKVKELNVQYIIADDLLNSSARIGCSGKYEGEMLRYLYFDCTHVARIEYRYPNFWVRGGMIKEINIFKRRDESPAK